MPSPDSETSSTSWRTLAVLAALVLLALGIRLNGITQESAWGDEAVTLRHLPAPSLAVYWDRVFTEDPILRLVPGFYLVQYHWNLLAGTDNTLLVQRLLAVTLGCTSLVLLFFIVRTLAGARAAGAAALFFALSLFHTYYAQEVRFYPLLTCLAMTSLLGFVKALGGQGRGWWGLHAVANAALLFTHTFSIPFFAAQGLFLLGESRRQPRRLIVWTAGHLVLGASFAVWLLYLRYDLGSESEVYNDIPPDLARFAEALLIFAGGRLTGENPAPYMPGGISLDKLMALAFLAALVWTVREALGRRKLGETWGRARTARWLLCWLFVPLVFLFVVSWAWKPVFYIRYIIYAAVAVPAILAFALSAIPSPRPRVVLLAILAAVFLYQNLALPRPMRPGYAPLARDINADPDGPVAVNALKVFNAYGVDYALGPDDPRLTTYPGYGELLRDTEATAKAGTPVWAVFRDAGLRVEEYEYAGMPPLKAARVSRP